MRAIIEKWIFNHRAKKQKKVKKVYLVVCYAKWCVREYSYAGKMIYNKYINCKAPLVYYFNDHNGCKDEWQIINICDTTTGMIENFYFDINEAENKVNILNKRMENKDEK